MNGFMVVALAACVVAVHSATTPSQCEATCNAECDASNQFCSGIFGVDGCASAYQACKQTCTQGCACLDPCVAGCGQAKLGCEGDNPSYTVAAICYVSQFYCLNTCPEVCEVRLEEQALEQIIAQITAYFQAMAAQASAPAP